MPGCFIQALFFYSLIPTRLYAFTHHWWAIGSFSILGSWHMSLIIFGDTFILLTLSVIKAKYVFAICSFDQPLITSQDINLGTL